MTTHRLPSFAGGLTLVLFAALAGGAHAQTAPPRAPAAPPPWLPHYDLDVRLDVPGHKAHVRQRVTWTNMHARPAGEIVFNAHAHYLVPGDQVGLLAKTLEILHMNADEGLYSDRNPLEVREIRVGGKALDYAYQGDTATDLVVLLPSPVARGQSVVVELDFTLHLPQKQGRWGQWESVTQLSNWVPMAAVYDDAGWHPTPFVPWHQPFYNEAGVFRARVTLPADHKVAASGTVASTRPLDGGMQEVTIQADAVRDFAFLASPRYVAFEAEAPTLPGLPPVRVHVMAFPEHEHHARAMLQTICKVFPYYSRWIGPYPWTDYTVAESFFGWNGNECATLVMIDERVFGMPHVGAGYVEYLMAHETCHQWWYNLIGTDGYRETWMDEAMATFWAHKYLDLEHGFNSKLLHYPRGLEWLPNIDRETYRSTGIYGVIGRGELGPTIQEMPKFGHIANLFGICYDKGSRIVGLIEDRLGETAFLDFTRRIYDRYAFRILRVADYQRELEEFTGRSWEEFFRRWLYGAGVCDWSVEKVTVEPLEGRRSRRLTPNFLSALHANRAGRCKVTVVLHQKGDYDEQTTLGFCLRDESSEDGRPQYPVRVPILPQAGVLEHPDQRARVETLPDHRVRVEIELPCEPVQIAVDPDNLLVDRDPANNTWKPRVRFRFTPLYTLLDEADLTGAYDRWNVTAGPWASMTAYADPWYQRATIAGFRVGATRMQQFNGGAYVGYRTSFRDVVAGVDGVWDHWPWPKTQVGFNAEYRLASAFTNDTHPSRGSVFGRYVFNYNSSLYLPPIHYVEAFASAQQNFLPYERRVLLGGQRYEDIELAGLHYHLNYLTPYWDPKGGMALDLTYAGGVAELDKRVGVHQLQGQFSIVKGLPDLSGHLDESSGVGRVAEPVLRWLGETRLAARVAGAGGLPDRGQFFALGGDTMFRGFDMRERQGSLVWLGSLEWRFPLLRGMKWDCVDHVFATRNLSGAVFYDVGDAYVRGHSYGTVAHGVGAGLRLDVTLFGFVERTTLRVDVAKAVNAATPLQFSVGANFPF